MSEPRSEVRDRLDRSGSQRMTTAVRLGGGLLLVGIALWVAALEPVRDESIAFDLLRHGELVLSGDVARELPVEQSVLQIRRVGLSRNGLLIRAAFRDKSRRVDERGEGGYRYRDAYYNELAAYLVARALGLNFIPPTVLRSLPISARGLDRSDTLRQGTLQLWVENAAVAYDVQRGAVDFPGDPRHRNQQLAEIRVFDCIIGNVDRHAGNALVDLTGRYPRDVDAAVPPEPYFGKIWAIDHSKAFHNSPRAEGKHCRLSKFTHLAISRQFMQGLRGWQLSALERELRASGLSERQLDRLNLEALDARLHKVRHHFEAALADSGFIEDVFFSSGLWHRVW